jgi:hypothetical protein
MYDKLSEISVVQQRSVIPMVCGRCKHAWDYSGHSRYYATCPRCRIYLRIEKHAAITKREKPTTTKTGPTSPSTNQSDVVIGSVPSIQGGDP